ncbi:MAG TPA: tetratricopeptide repeat protein [Ktedonobacteraceae bacterium]|jgi:tetratricopeptide (TPR) repeat protein|nr:tetratricopeptide repeat protein [Ktedonobacteraceae bacterium]
MQSLPLTPETMRKHYTTALDALYEIAASYYMLGRLHDAQHLLHLSLQLLESEDAQPQHRLKLLLLYGKVLIASLLLSRQDADLLFSIVQDAKQTADALQDQQGIADALSLLGQAHLFATIVASLKRGEFPDSPRDQGKYTEAFAYQQQSLELREALHDTRGISESLFFIGNVYQFWQHYDQAQEHFAKAYALAEQHGHSYEKTEPARHLALFALNRGDLEQALTYARQALTFREAASFKLFLPLDHLLLRSVYQAQGDTTSAQFHLQQASAIAEEIGHSEIVSSILKAESMQASQK